MSNAHTTTPIAIPPLNRVDVASEDLLDAIKTIEPECQFQAHDAVKEWTKSSVYLKWATEDMATNCDRGWSNAMHNAKRAVCRRIDELVFANHLDCLLGRTYPEKLASLEAVGETAPSIVQTLVIDQRNAAEHRYARVSESAARDAVQLAGLFVGATAPAAWDPAWDRDVRCLFGAMANYGSHTTSARSAFVFYQVPRDPFLLIDVYAPIKTAFIVNCGAQELLASSVANFSPSRAKDLATWCRNTRPPHSGTSRDVLSAMMTTLGIARV